MKTAEEKAKEFCSINGLTHGVQASLVLLLQEQDRYTRSSCANAMLELSGNSHIKKDDAHAACMNVKAV